LQGAVQLQPPLPLQVFYRIKRSSALRRERWQILFEMSAQIV
jgi:hypothetical protein